MRPGFDFTIQARDGAARSGVLRPPPGEVPTPAFMPVATYGAVRGVSVEELSGLGAHMLLSNTFHLHERPGEGVVEKLGGLHGFTGWRGPWLTDSGGFQVTSLADRLSIDEDGVTFSSPLDGARRRLTPETAVAIQEALGADVAMVLDECQPPEAGEEVLRAASERTLRWAERARRAHRRPDQALFGIVQGGPSPAQRREHAERTVALDFDGYAHGGLGLGEARALRGELVGAAHLALPETAPRYLMGLGKPRDLVEAIEAGVDLFDCVIPTRHARHGVLFTRAGLLRIRTAPFLEDDAPPDPDCDCPTCGRHSRAYVRHLLRGGEALGARLASVHNLRFYLGLMERARAAIRQGRLAALSAEIADAYPD